MFLAHIERNLKALDNAFHLLIKGRGALVVYKTEVLVLTL
jgi:hypothetical protein